MEPIIVLAGILVAIIILIALVLAPLKLYSIDGKLADLRDELAALNAEARASRLELAQQTQLLQAISRNVAAGSNRNQA